MRFVFALFINKWTDLAKFFFFFLFFLESFYRISYVSTTRYTIIQQLTRNTTYSRMKVRTIAFLHSSSSPPPQTETIFVTISLEIFSKSVRPCNEATPSALFSSSSFQTIVTQRSVNKRELISCCPTRFVSGNLDKFFNQRTANQTRFRSSSTRQRKRKFARPARTTRAVSWNPLSFHGKYRLSIHEDGDTREKNRDRVS